MKETKTVEYIDGVARRYALYLEDDFLKVELEELDGNPFLHVEVKEWSREVLRYAREGWELLYYELWLEGYSKLFSYNTNKRFAELVSGVEWKSAGHIPKELGDVEVLYIDIKEPSWVSKQP